MNLGIQVRTLLSHHQDDASIVLMSVEIWPLPISITEELKNAIDNAIKTILVDKGLVSGEITDLHVKAPIQ